VQLPVVSSAEMRAAEAAAFAGGATAEELMDEAAAGIARCVMQFFPQPGRCLVVAGKGNNAGDAFAAAAILQQHGWSVQVQLAFSWDELGGLARKKLQAIQQQHNAGPGGRLIILDGLLGLGSEPPLRDPVLSACREINQLRQTQNAFVFAIDLPTGMNGDTGEADADAVIADCTVTIAAAKQGLLTDQALRFVGRLAVVPLARVQLPNDSSRAIVATADTLRHLLPRREFSGYKNQYGRVGVIAGSRGLTGAALLCCAGALRAGAGLVNVFVREDIYPIVASAAPWEAMVIPVRSYREALERDIAAWAIGPGLGNSHADEILQLVEEVETPMVLDADGLNIVAQQMEVLGRARGPRLLTPHPGEMKRLGGEENRSRAQTASEFTQKHSVTLLLKGSRTIVAERGQPLSYNTTGTPAMATGGMGDVLTGVCAALLAQKLSPFDAARLGTWACARAAEIALFNGTQSEQSLLPRDIVEHLGLAFREVA
jgi:ADP-dependent NAD(P)H-hydrate dehydratase / NAD(P)H-hydrate epimerase